MENPSPRTEAASASSALATTPSSRQRSASRASAASSRSSNGLGFGRHARRGGKARRAPPRASRAVAASRKKPPPRAGRSTGRHEMFEAFGSASGRQKRGSRPSARACRACARLRRDARLVEHGERPDRPAVCQRGVVDQIRRDALGDHGDGFVEIGGEDAGWRRNRGRRARRSGACRAPRDKRQRRRRPRRSCGLRSRPRPAPCARRAKRNAAQESARGRQSLARARDGQSRRVGGEDCLGRGLLDPRRTAFLIARSSGTLSMTRSQPCNRYRARRFDLGEDRGLCDGDRAGRARPVAESDAASLRAPAAQPRRCARRARPRRRRRRAPARSRDPSGPARPRRRGAETSAMELDGIVEASAADPRGVRLHARVLVAEGDAEKQFVSLAATPRCSRTMSETGSARPCAQEAMPRAVSASINVCAYMPMSVASRASKWLRHEDEDRVRSVEKGVVADIGQLAPDEIAPLDAHRAIELLRGVDLPLAMNALNLRSAVKSGLIGSSRMPASTKRRAQPPRPRPRRHAASTAVRCSSRAQLREFEDFAQGRFRDFVGQKAAHGTAPADGFVDPSWRALVQAHGPSSISATPRLA